MLYGSSSTETDVQPITQRTQPATVDSRVFPVTLAGESPNLIEVAIQRLRGGGLRPLTVDSLAQGFADMPWCSTTPEITPT